MAPFVTRARALFAAIACCRCLSGSAETSVAIVGERWHINGGITNPNSPAAGLLPNARMIQGVFDDTNESTRSNWAYPDTHVWDPERNTDEFVGNMSSWRNAGLLSFTVGLQGGSPHCYGNFGWHVSAFDSKGNLDSNWADRLQRIIRRADELGMVVIVQYFYGYQFGRVFGNNDPTVVNNAIRAATTFLINLNANNVIIDVYNEHCTASEAALVSLVHNISEAAGHRLMTSTSCGGGRLPSPEVVTAADFILIHGNGQTPEKITELIGSVRAMPEFQRHPKPIVFNEDDHGNFTAPASNLNSAVASNASWGFLCCCDGTVQGDYRTGYQCPPVDWRFEGQCLSGPKGLPMPHGSKPDWEAALKRVTTPDEL
eukprot:m.490589 g.490589  ORF g.490589 m.490589 type:complete len:372 (-) comp21780_c0_seq1:2372-3487(-)